MRAVNNDFNQSSENYTICKKSRELAFTLLILEFLWAQESRRFIFNPIALSIKAIDKELHFQKKVLRL
jgi:hypothetical protein